jgi:hypothetical protein
MSLRTLGSFARLRLAHLSAFAALLVPGLAVAATVGGYVFLPAPAAERGVLRPIAGDPAYGYSFIDERGWYSATLPSGGKTQAGSRPGTRTFEFTSGGNTAICSAATFEGGKGRTFEQLQAGIPQLKASFESSAARQLTVQESGILELRDDGANHVRGAYWAGLSARNLYITMMVIEVPRGNIIIGCETRTIALSKYLTTMVFRLAEGGL